MNVNVSDCLKVEGFADVVSGDLVKLQHFLGFHLCLVCSLSRSCVNMNCEKPLFSSRW